MSDTTWITLEEAARYLHKPARQVHGYCRDGRLEYKKEKGQILVAEDSIMIFMELMEGRRIVKPVPEEVTPPKPAEPPLIASAGDAAPTSPPEAEDPPEPEVVPRVMAPVKAAEVPIEPTIEEIVVPVAPPPVAEEAVEPVTPAIEEEIVEPAIEAPIVEKAIEPAIIRPPIVEKALEPTIKAPTAHINNPEPERDVGQEGFKTMENGSQIHYNDLLISIRAGIKKHMETQQAFCTDMLNLLDSLEEVCKREAQKESQLTQDIASILSRYTKEDER